MNNLELWKLIEDIVREAWKNWHPHFEVLTTGAGEKIMAFFMFRDTDVEWKLYQSIPEGIAGEFAVRMESVKEELLETVGFEIRYEDTEATEHEAEDMSENLLKLMKQYEETGLSLNRITYRRLFNKELHKIQGKDTNFM